jgi:hypothetical protein
VDRVIDESRSVADLAGRLARDHALAEEPVVDRGDAPAMLEVSGELRDLGVPFRQRRGGGQRFERPVDGHAFEARRAQVDGFAGAALPPLDEREHRPAEDRIPRGDVVLHRLEAWAA